ncbi:MAG: hypothetical protein ACQEXJ_12090 [Myxococcota bacterium]
MEIMVYASGLEAVITAWYASSQSDSSGLYLPNEEYLRRLGNAPEIIAERLSGLDAAERIAGKLKHANRFGFAEKTRRFFEEIGLEIGSTEKRALKMRGKFAHGGQAKPGEASKYIRLKSGVLTLLHRVLLKMLGYGGRYVDIGTEGHPVRHIDVPSGGQEE